VEAQEPGPSSPLLATKLVYKCPWRGRHTNFPQEEEDCQNAKISQEKNRTEAA
jgi:hypothetical protein